MPDTARRQSRGDAAIADALGRVVSSGATVLDLSVDFGQIGVRACALGASRIYALRSASYGAIVSDVAAANGCGDRITVIHDLSELPKTGQGIDVVVGRLEAALPIATADLLTLRRHFASLFSPHVVFIPRHEIVRAAFV